MTAAAAEPGLLAWRERILATILRVAIPLGLVVYIPSLYLSIVSNLPGIAFIDTVVMAGAVVIYFRPHWPYTIRAGLLTILIYVLGVWLLIDVGPISQIYLFGFSVLAGLLLTVRAAIFTIFLNAATLAVVGFWARAHFDTNFFPSGSGLMAWLVITLNFILVNTLLCVPLAILLRGLESSVEDLRETARDLESERSQLVAANERLSHEVEERERAEARVHRLVLAIEQAAEVIIITDAMGNPEYVNAAYDALAGVPRVEGLAQGEALLRILSRDGLEVLGVSSLLQEPFDEERTINLLTRDGQSTRQVKAAVSRLSDTDGVDAGYVVVLRDVSTEALLEQRLRQSQKLEAIGTLAGGIAHDFNNILSSILGHAELLQSRMDDDPEAQEWSREIVTASIRAKGLIRQILLFSRHRTQKYQSVRLMGIVDETLRLLRPSLPSTVEIQVDNQAPNASVIGDATELHQVIMNLCTNAYQAMERDGGVLTISVASVQSDQTTILSHPRLKRDKNYIRLNVGDTGRGIDPQTRERIFDPFFTTKEKGKGTGLGLATVHGIVMSMEGDITVYSEIGAGTTISIYLPEDTSDLQAFLAPASDEAAPDGTNIRVLIVDDEEAILRLSGRILERQGFIVERCLSSVEALAHVTERPGYYQLVITDLTMPKKTGFQLAREIRDLEPNLPIILMSGFNEALSTTELDHAGITTFIHKPFTHREMYAAIGKALQNRA